MRIRFGFLIGAVVFATACAHRIDIDTRGLHDLESAVTVTDSTIDILFPKVDRDNWKFPRGDERQCASPRLSWQIVFEVPPSAQSIPFRQFAFSVHTELLKRPQHTLSNALTNGILRACTAESHFLFCATPVDGSVQLYHGRLRIRLARRGVIAQLLSAVPSSANVNFLFNCDPWIGGSVPIRYLRAGA